MDWSCGSRDRVTALSSAKPWDQIPVLPKNDYACYMKNCDSEDRAKTIIDR
jgi:hypothetical protein